MSELLGESRDRRFTYSLPEDVPEVRALVNGRYVFRPKTYTIHYEWTTTGRLGDLCTWCFRSVALTGERSGRIVHTLDELRSLLGEDIAREAADHIEQFLTKENA